MTPVHVEYNSKYFEDARTSKTPEAADRYARILRRHVGMSGARILDVGCGTGVVLDRLAREEGWNCFGVDISSEALSRRAGANGRDAAADALSLPFADGTFDAVLLFDVIEHLEGPPAGLMEARRVSRVGASLMVTTPNSNSPFRRLLGARWHGLHDKTHLCLFTSFTLSYLLRQTGWAPMSSGTTSGGPHALRPMLEAFRVGGELYFIACAV